jgi:hypothetical protein
MATSNRDRIGSMFDVMAPALDEFITAVMTPELPAGTGWVQLIELRDSDKGIKGKKYSALEPTARILCK